MIDVGDTQPVKLLNHPHECDWLITWPPLYLASNVGIKCQSLYITSASFKIL